MNPGLICDNRYPLAVGGAMHWASSVYIIRDRTLSHSRLQHIRMSQDIREFPSICSCLNRGSPPNISGIDSNLLFDNHTTARFCSTVISPTSTSLLSLKSRTAVVLLIPASSESDTLIMSFLPNRKSYKTGNLCEDTFGKRDILFLYSDKAWIDLGKLMFPIPYMPFPWIPISSNEEKPSKYGGINISASGIAEYRSSTVIWLIGGPNDDGNIIHLQYWHSNTLSNGLLSNVPLLIFQTRLKVKSIYLIFS